MRIAVNTRFLLQDSLEGIGYFSSETLKRITRTQPQHDFLFIFDRPFDDSFLFAPNVKGIVCSPPARHPLLWKYWYDVKLPAVIKKWNADVFVSLDGFCSLRLNIPQLLVVHDLAFFHYPRYYKRSHMLFHKRYTGRFLRKAAAIATVSEFSKNDILSRYKIPSGKISVVYNGVKQIFQPLAAIEKNKIQKQYSGGHEYFIYTGAIHPRKNLVNLLKAFSLFKKRQRSSMKLVLTGRLAWKYEGFLKDLKTYKYRDDVILTGYLEENELATVMAAAYALVYPSFHEGFGVPVLEAMQSAIPVITSSKSSMQEIAGEAALYAEPSDPSSIAEQMMRIYKDETLRSKLITAGVEKVKQFSWDKTAALLWDLIERTAR